MHTPRDQHKVYNECLRISVIFRLCPLGQFIPLEGRNMGLTERMSSAWNWLIEGFNFLLQALAT